MTENKNVAAGELNKLLTEMRENSAAQVPPEAMAVMTKTVQDLAASGQADKSLQEGAKAPDFTLPNLRGEQVSLSGLLAKGPVVLAFYRGDW